MATILVVDDDPGIRQLLTDLLEMDGHVVAVAVDGHDGLRALEVVRPDFVILDVMMPGLDATACCAASAPRRAIPCPS